MVEEIQIKIKEIYFLRINYLNIEIIIINILGQIAKMIQRKKIKEKI